MKTISFSGSLHRSGALKGLNVKPGPGGDLLILPDMPAVAHAKKVFANTDSAPFIKTFVDLARNHNALGSGRKQILSRTGRAILMRKALENRSSENRFGTELSDLLLRLNARLKQRGLSAYSILEKGKEKLPKETFEKLAAIEPILAEFDALVEKFSMIDDTIALRSLAGEIEAKKTHGVCANVSRIVAAGFHSLTPSQLKILEAAETGGIPSLLVTAQPRKGADKPRIFLSPFPLMTNEADSTAAEIRRMIDGGRSPEDFAVIIRELSSVSYAVAEIFKKNGVPFTFQSGIRLGSASGISVLLKDFLAAAQSGFGAAEFIRLLRNPMLEPFFAETDNAPEAISEMESEFIKTGARRETEEKDFERITKPLRNAQNSQKALSKITELKDMVSEALCTNCSPLTAGTMFEGLSSLIDKTGAYQNPLRDRSFEETRKLLREAAFLCKKTGGKTLTHEEFSGLLSELLIGRSYSLRTHSRAPCVRIMNALQSRGTSYPIVFVLDCCEQSFPLPPGNAIFNDDEKKLINGCYGFDALTSDAAHFKDEKLIWHSVLACADEELHISFSLAGTEGERKNRSHFIEELAQNSVMEERKRDVTELLQNPYCTESVRAEAFDREGKIPKSLEKLLRENDPFFNLADTAGKGAAAENERLAAEGKFGAFEGIVPQTEESVWKNMSVSGVEKFGTCPFMFFCSDVLGIKEVSKTGEIPAASDTGKLYHAALKHIFSHGTDSSPWEKTASETDRVLHEFLNDAETKKLHCRVSDDVWKLQKERARLIAGRFVEFEKERMRKGNFKPELFESEVLIQIDGTEIRGRLDRMDISPAGARVVDYKKGSVKHSGPFCDRANVQVPLYLGQISRDLQIRPAAAAYVSVEKPWEENARTADGRGGIPVEEATDLARSNINLIKQGFFSPVPVAKPYGFPYERKIFLKRTDRPCGTCSYSDICRLKDGVLRKAEKEDV